MSESTDFLLNAVSAFLETCGRDYEFPAGWQHDLLTKQEQALLEVLLDCELSVKHQISTLSSGLDWSDCYSLVIFGVRLAILAVRREHQRLYGIGLVVLVAGSPKVDWRDALGAFAIFNECGRRICVDFQSEVELIAASGDIDKLQPTLDSFFLRDDQMRAVDAMGFQECGAGDSLMFRAKGMF
ncbi:MAG: hypothetical protein Q8M16_03715 [Pirellulaceae bacterium]|nr:hypothetical protein [Pirellulaceae bacterium]